MYRKKLLTSASKSLALCALVMATAATCLTGCGGKKATGSANVEVQTSQESALEKPTAASQETLAQTPTEAATAAAEEKTEETTAEATETASEEVTEAPAEVAEAVGKAEEATEGVKEEAVQEAVEVQIENIVAQEPEPAPEVSAPVTYAPAETKTEAPTVKKIESPTDANGVPQPISSDNQGLTGGHINNPDGTYTNRLGTWASREDFFAWSDAEKASRQAAQK